MNDSNQFPHQGFAAYNRPSAAHQNKTGIVEKVFGPRMARRLKSPLVATGGLLLVGAVFAGVILTSYPDEESDGNVPVIKAETTAFKDMPESVGGMDIPFQDSTIFSSMQGGGMKETAPIENLLAQEEPVDRFAMLDAAEAEAEAIAETEPASGMGDSEEGLRSTINEAAPPEKIEDVADVAPFEIHKMEQKTEKISPQDLMAAAAAKAKAETPEKPEQIYAAGASPDTLDFVRSVLDKKDTENVGGEQDIVVSEATATQAATIEPSAGSIAASAIQPGEYYVQLASVTSTDGAESEWGKLQKSYGSLLQTVSHRVKRADLDKGTFYRIQAGPMSKESANRLCDEIKAQKPGGCLVTK